MKRQRARLGELCALVKGTSPISKTRPGPYPLVTTGEEHKTADTFQLDTEAVCIPLISSTGHGHASLKRVHYQTGKFALANLLVAALVKDNSVLSAKFLTQYLMFTKDRLIVPLMTGAANMSISINRLATVPIEFPPLEAQQRIVKLLDEADELRKLRAQADRRTAALIPALFHEMFGDPEKNRNRWPVFNFGELLSEPLRNGVSPAKDGSHTAKVFTLSAITGEHFNPSAWKDASFARPPDRTSRASELLFLICRGNGNKELVGRAKFPWGAGDNFVFPDTMIAGIPNAEMLLPSFLEEAWRLPVIRSQIASGARTTNGTFKINQTVIEQIRLLVPPLPLQKEFAQRVTEIRELEAAQAASSRRLEDLFQSLLHRAFNGDL